MCINSSSSNTVVTLSLSVTGVTLVCTVLSCSKTFCFELAYRHFCVQYTCEFQTYAKKFIDYNIAFFLNTH